MNSRKYLILVFLVSFSAIAFSQTTERDELINSILSNRYDTDVTVFGEHGNETRTFAVLRTKILVIKNETEIMHPRGEDFTIVIVSDSIHSEKNSKIISSSNILIKANYGAGIIEVENTRGRPGTDGIDWSDAALPINTQASNGRSGGSGRDAGCGVDFPSRVWRRSANGGDPGGPGANGQKGINGNKGLDGENGTDAGTITFICKKFQEDSEVYINAIGGPGGKGGKGQAGGTGQKGGNGGGGGKGGKGSSSCGGLSPKDGGNGGNGGRGGDGGDGGDGGNGGNGGNGGFVKIYSLKNEVAPLVYVINNLGGQEGSPGEGGDGGQPGLGGAPGTGGRGGTGNFWTGVAGRGDGGAPGKPGSTGKPGKMGNPGLKGKRGRILVEADNTYIPVEEDEITVIIRNAVSTIAM